MRAVSILVIGSGDVCTPEDETSLAQGERLRSFYGRASATAALDALPEASKEERIALLVDYARLLAEDLPERLDRSPQERRELNDPILGRRSTYAGGCCGAARPKNLLDHVRRAADVSADELVGEESDTLEQDAPSWSRVAQAEATWRAPVLVTVVETKGSTPRKAGARMLVDADGACPVQDAALPHPEGTIGGGAVEAQAIRLALAWASAAPWCDGWRWVPRWMCCGGSMTLLAQPLIEQPTLIILGFST